MTGEAPGGAVVRTVIAAGGRVTGPAGNIADTATADPLVQLALDRRRLDTGWHAAAGWAAG